MSEEDLKLGIELAQLTVVPAWQIGGSSPLIAAMGGIEAPVIPDDVTDPPFAEVLRRLDEMKQHRAF
ncbi:hypothetical protein D3C85_1849630 [compost metagenome]